MALGPYQIIIVLAVAFLLFKGGRIPALMKDIGEGISKFKHELSRPSE